MLEYVGDIWDFHRRGCWIVVTTNGFVKKNGEAVMGRGIAKQAAMRFKDFPFQLGKMLDRKGNHVLWFWDKRILTFPVKHNWFEKADPELIERSCVELQQWADRSTRFKMRFPIYMVRPGCGNGGLTWEQVKPILDKYFDNRFCVCEYAGDVA